MSGEFVEAPHQDVVLFSRVRLNRNYEDLPFSGKITREYADEVVRRTADAVLGSEQGHAYAMIKLADLSEDARSSLVEHNLISYDLLRFAQRSAALISTGKTVTVMMGEEDHLRLQGLLPGLQLERTAELALSMDEMLSEKYAFAFDSQWGFLTSSPANVGTGMRACVVMHLPALTAAGQMGPIMQAVAKLGLTVRGLYGEGSETLGNLYQMSNQATLGRSEEDVIRSLLAAAGQIAGHERAQREQAEKQDMMKLQDTLLRSMGEMMYARLMPVNEMMRRYSDVRYAASMGYVHASLAELDNLIRELQPGSLAVSAGKLLGSREGEILRAKLLREKLPGLVAN